MLQEINNGRFQLVSHDFLSFTLELVEKIQDGYELILDSQGTPTGFINRYECHLRKAVNSAAIIQQPTEAPTSPPEPPKVQIDSSVAAESANAAKGLKTNPKSNKK